MSVDLIGESARDPQSIKRSIDHGFNAVQGQEARLAADRWATRLGKSPFAISGKGIETIRLCLSRSDTPEGAGQRDSRGLPPERDVLLLVRRHPISDRSAMRTATSTPSSTSRMTRSTNINCTLNCGCARRSLVTMGRMCNRPNTTGAVTISSPRGSAFSPQRHAQASSSSSSAMRHLFGKRLLPALVRPSG